MRDMRLPEASVCRRVRRAETAANSQATKYALSRTSPIVMTIFQKMSTRLFVEGGSGNVNRADYCPDASDIAATVYVDQRSVSMTYAPTIPHSATSARAYRRSRQKICAPIAV